MKRSCAFFVGSLMILMGFFLPCFARVSYETAPEAIYLTIEGVREEGVRVWHTLSPMKVIVDLDREFDVPLETVEIDVALKAIRRSQSPLGGTRLVLDFHYQVPEAIVIWSEGTLHITVPKLFVRSQVNTVVPGLRYGHERRGIQAGPLIINYLEVDIRRPSLSATLVLAQDLVLGREYVSSMAKRSYAIAAVNGAFFAGDGLPLGLLVLDGAIVSESFRSRTALGLGPHGAFIGPVSWGGTVVLSDGKSRTISGVNRSRGTDELILYNSFFGGETRTNVYGMEVVVVEGTVVDIRVGGGYIPKEGLVVSGHGLSQDFLRNLSVGDLVDVSWELTPDWTALGVTAILGGGPQLVKDGDVYVTSEEEGFQRDVAYSRAPRTALGITREGRLLIVTVNGRKPNISVGMTLEELAHLMIELGAYEAMNLDGGGSTTMVIRDRVLNLPSDGLERKVSNSLVILYRE